MPLKPGTSAATVGHNIEEMQDAGYPHNVAVAAALHTADTSSGGHAHDKGGAGSSHSAAVKAHMATHREPAHDPKH